MSFHPWSANRYLHWAQAAGGCEGGQDQRVNIQCLRFKADLLMTVQSPFSSGISMCVVWQFPGQHTEELQEVGDTSLLPSADPWKVVERCLACEAFNNSRRNQNVAPQSWSWCCWAVNTTDGNRAYAPKKKKKTCWMQSVSWVERKRLQIRKNNTYHHRLPKDFPHNCQDTINREFIASFK